MKYTSPSAKIFSVQNLMETKKPEQSVQSQIQNKLIYRKSAVYIGDRC